jgi:hypothetical protein
MIDSTVVAALAHSAGLLVSHRFDVIDALDDGYPIPVEALSEDHSIGIYGSVAPRKMRDHAETYTLADISEFRPQRTVTVTPLGYQAEEFLEYVPLRGVHFSAEDLQYLESGWDASLTEVKYALYTVLALTHVVREAFGSALLYLNRTLPMPVWIRTEPLEAETVRAQVAVQVMAGGRMRPTNIHTECPMEYARRWTNAARNYYDPA